MQTAWSLRSLFTRALLLGLAAFVVSAPAAVAAPEGHGTVATEEVHATASAHGEEIAHGEEASDAEEHEAGGHLELPNLLLILLTFFIEEGTPAYHYVEMFENSFFALVAGLFLCWVAMGIYRRRQMLPGRLQVFAEMIVEWIESLAISMMGEKDGRKYTPFIASIFVYLAAMNYFVLVPLGKSPTSTFINNISIALVVFVYVQYTGIRRNGIGGYLYHFAGQPKDLVGWLLSPLLFFLEVFGEFVKPISLSFRLFGNIFGEDMLLAVFAFLGVVVMSWANSPVGIPLHLPFYFLAMLLGLIQALVFSLLTMVYIALMLPHGEHAEHTEHTEHVEHESVQQAG